MHGLGDGNEAASLQMQFFWKYLNRLSNKQSFQHAFFGDSALHANSKNERTAKSDSKEVGNDVRLAFKQVSTFLNSLTALEDALLQVVFDFISRERLYKRDHFDFAQVSKHLNHAIFLDDDVMMFEKMPANQILLKAGEHDIVGMAAMVLKAIYEELLFWKPEDSSWKLPAEATHLIQEFQEKFHLPLKIKLFEDWSASNKKENGITTSQMLRDNLKSILSDIDEQTPFKTPDYEDYYDALHGVLFNGNCSLTSLMPAYHQAWEELSLLHYSLKEDIEIVWVDKASTTIKFALNKSQQLSKEDFTDIRSRWPSATGIDSETINKRPDLVYCQTKNNDGSTSKQYTVVDFKHYDSNSIRTLCKFSPVEVAEESSEAIPPKHCTDIKSLNFYAISIDRKINPYGSNLINCTQKLLCFPGLSTQAVSQNEYFNYEKLSTEELMKKYLE